MIAQFSNWYSELYSKNPTLVISITALALALLTFILNFIAKPILKYIIAKIRNSKEGAEKKKEIKRSTYSQLSALIHQFDLNVDKLIVDFNVSFFKSQEKAFNTGQAELDKLKINIEKQIQLKEQLTELYVSMNAEENRHIGIMKEIIAQAHATGHVDENTGEKSSSTLQKARQVFNQQKDKIESDLVMLDNSFEEYQLQLTSLRNSLQETRYYIDEENEKKVTVFYENLQSFTINLNSIPDLGIISSEHVVIYLEKVRKSAMELIVFVNQQIFETFSSSRLSDLINSSEFKKLRKANKDLLAFMRQELR